VKVCDVSFRKELTHRAGGRKVGGQAGDALAAAHGNRWPVTLASLAVGAAFFALWFWLLPLWPGFSLDIADMARWRWLASIPSVLGFAVALRCV
jgi:hypothetical protein